MDNPNLYSIRKAGIADISILSNIIRHAYKDVVQRFGLTPQNCPKHPSNYTDKWVQSDLDRGAIYYELKMDQDTCGCVQCGHRHYRPSARIKKWYIELGFVEGETKSFDHLPFEVAFLSMKVQLKTGNNEL